MSLDYTRKPQFNRHKDGGFFVVSYPDAPGDYFDERGVRVSDVVAEEAGYNVAEDRIERTKREKIAQARIDAENEAARKINEIRAGQGAVESKFKTEATPDGYRVLDLTGSVLRSGISYEEVVEVLMISNGLDVVGGEAPRPVLRPELGRNEKPTGKFSVEYGGKTHGAGLSRAEAEAVALKQIGG